MAARLGAATRRSALRTAMLVGSVNAFLLLALLVPVELIFGTWTRPMRLSDLKRFSIPFDQRFEFDVSGLYSGGPRNPMVYSRDRWGLRGSHRQLADVAVVTVGGSTTEQRYIDDTATWQEVAVRALATAGAPIVIANAGVDGQSTVGHAFSMEHWFPLLPDLRPRYYLFYVGSNDVLRQRNRDAFDRSMDATSWRFRSATYQLYRTLRSNLRARDAHVMHGRMPRPREDDFTSTGLLPPARQQEVASMIAERFVRNVEGLRARAEALGATAIFMTQTSFGWNAADGRPRGRRESITIYGLTVNFADVSVFHQSLNRALLAYCERSGAICFDVANDVAFDAADYYDYLHNTPRGAEKIGRYLAGRLAGLPLAAAR